MIDGNTAIFTKFVCGDIDVTMCYDGVGIVNGEIVFNIFDSARTINENLFVNKTHPTFITRELGNDIGDVRLDMLYTGDVHVNGRWVYNIFDVIKEINERLLEELDKLNSR
jgi:hypothetical protein